MQRAVHREAHQLLRDLARPGRPARPARRADPRSAPRLAVPVVDPARGSGGADVDVAQERAVGLRQGEREDVGQRVPTGDAAVQPAHGGGIEQRELDPRAARTLPGQDAPGRALKP